MLFASFGASRYLEIVKGEGLEISQPALDPGKSEVHHQITARGRRSKVHRLFLISSFSRYESVFKLEAYLKHLDTFDITTWRH